MGMQEMMEKAMKGMESIPKCDNCGGHLAGGALTFNSIHSTQVTWCMKCVLGAIKVFEETKEKRLHSQ